MAVTETVGGTALFLPFELQTRIATSCHRATIASLTRIHTSWTAACEEVLYAHVTMNNARDTPLLARTVTSNPRKAALVRALDVPRKPAYTMSSREIVPRFAAAYCEVISAARNLRFLQVPLMGVEASTRVTTLLRAGHLDGLLVLVVHSVHPLKPDVGHPAELHEAVLSLRGDLRVLVVQGAPSLALVREYRAGISAACSVVARNGPNRVSVYPALYSGGSRLARYLEDCVFALLAPVVQCHPESAEARDPCLVVHAAFDDLSPVPRVVQAIAPHLPGLASLSLCFAPPAQHPAPLPDVPEILTAVAPLAQTLSWLDLTCAPEWKRHTAWADGREGDFAARLGESGLPALSTLHFGRYFDWFARDPGRTPWQLVTRF